VLAIQTGLAAIAALALPAMALGGALLVCCWYLLLAGPRARHRADPAGNRDIRFCRSLDVVGANWSPNLMPANAISVWMMGLWRTGSMNPRLDCAALPAGGGLLRGSLGRGLDALTLVKMRQKRWDTPFKATAD